MALMVAQPRIDVESPVMPAAVFDPPIIRPGETSTYRVTFNALEASIRWPGTPTAPAQLALRPGGHGQALIRTGTNLQPHTSFNYRARPSKPGRFTVPQFTVTVYGKSITVPAAQLEVTNLPPPGLPPAQQLLLDVPDTNQPLFVGQTVRARIMLPGLSASALRTLSQVQLVGQGFIADRTPAPQRFEPMPLGSPPNPAPSLPSAAAPQRLQPAPLQRGGNNVVTLIYDTDFTPIAAGKVSLFAQAFAVGGFPSGPVVIRGGGGPVTIQGGLPQYTLLDSDPVELEVRPLPRQGELPGFTGAVGTFACDPPVLSTNVVRAGDSVKLTVKVRGEGNLVRLVPPPPPQPREWQVLPGTPENLPPQIIHAQGFTMFSYTMIPLTAEAQATPPIPFSCFDPKAGTYTDLTIPPVPITVTRGAVSADLQALLQANARGGEPEKEPALSGLAASPGLAAASLVPLQQQAWFPLVQLAPAAAFLGFWSWDRRRRYFEQHPDLVLRRRARRALRRQRRLLQRAARAGDASGFAAAAVGALRIACAPHYPAEPRALVGSDVLALLPEAECSGPASAVVRRFFSVTDAARFATAPADARELLALQPELEGVLQKLEERL